MNNIIFDGNYLFYKTLFIFGGYTNGNTRILESKNSQEMFMRKIATDMSYAIRQFGSPNRVIFTIDSQSWRKEILIEENDGYKSNRKRGDDVNWDNFYALMNEFAKILENQGIIVSRITRAEGDDLMYLWSQSLLKSNQNSIIITGDRDLHQLVRLKNNHFIVIYNPNSKSRKLYAEIGFREWLNQENIDLFDATSFMNSGQDLIRNVLEKIQLQEFDPNEYLFHKILIGDPGDAVPSVFSWVVRGKDGKERLNKLTPMRVEKILLSLKEKYGKFSVFDLPNFSQEIAKNIEKLTKQKADPSEIQNKIQRNIKLVVLSHQVIPNDILEAFQNHYKENIIKPTLTKRKYDLNSILEGTRFLKTSDIFQADIFAKLNKINNKN